MRFPPCGTRSSSNRVTTAPASEDRLVTGAALLSGIDGRAHPVKNPAISHAANEDLMVAPALAWCDGRRI